MGTHVAAERGGDRVHGRAHDRERVAAGLELSRETGHQAVGVSSLAAQPAIHPGLQPGAQRCEGDGHRGCGGPGCGSSAEECRHRRDHRGVQTCDERGQHGVHGGSVEGQRRVAEAIAKHRDLHRRGQHEGGRGRDGHADHRRRQPRDDDRDQHGQAADRQPSQLCRLGVVRATVADDEAQQRRQQQDGVEEGDATDGHGPPVVGHCGQPGEVRYLAEGRGHLAGRRVAEHVAERDEKADQGEQQSADDGCQQDGAPAARGQSAVREEQEQERHSRFAQGCQADHHETDVGQRQLATAGGGEQGPGASQAVEGQGGGDRGHQPTGRVTGQPEQQPRPGPAQRDDHGVLREHLRSEALQALPGSGERDEDRRGDETCARQHHDDDSQPTQASVSRTHARHCAASTSRCRVLTSQAEGDLGGALDLLHEAERLYEGDFLPRVHPVPALRARTWILHGRTADALGWARDQHLSFDDDLSYLREHVTLAGALLAEYALERAERTLDEATELLDRLLRAAEAGNRTGSVIEILVLQALARRMRGNVPARWSRWNAP
jgi:hypothetical protein